MHDLSIEPATIQDEGLLSRLLQLYFFDSTNWSEEDIQEDGTYECDEASLQSYLDAGSHHRAYVLRVDRKPAGFVLVEDVPFEEKLISEFADLFVLPKYRRLGLASAATKRIVIDSHMPWLLAVFRRDTQAMYYWHSAFKRLPFRSVRAADDPLDDRFHLFVVNEHAAY
jgi:predicted acetyltransferase